MTAGEAANANSVSTCEKKKVDDVGKQSVDEGTNFVEDDHEVLKQIA